MSGNVSLTSALRVCRVDAGMANKIESDRFLNPNNMLCPIWDGTNLKGQQVCPDSFWTKSAGCNSAEDRILVENSQRPKYFDFITLNAAGLSGDIYGPNVGNVDERAQSLSAQKTLYDVYNVTGSFGNDFRANRAVTSCSLNAYERAMAQEAQTMRQKGAAMNGFKAANYKSCGGM